MQQPVLCAVVQHLHGLEKPMHAAMATSHALHRSAGPARINARRRTMGAVIALLANIVLMEKAKQSVKPAQVGSGAQR